MSKASASPPSSQQFTNPHNGRSGPLLQEVAADPRKTNAMLSIADGPSWDQEPSDPEPLDTEWADAKLAMGWSPIRVALRYIIEEDGFTAQLFDWLCADGRDGEDVAQFARSNGVENREFQRAIDHMGEDRAKLTEAFISEGPYHPLPGAKAKSRVVAGYLDDLVVADPWDTTDGAERRRYRQLCEEHDWYWPQVSSALRQRRITAIEANTTGGPVEFTKLGIPVYPDRFPEPQPLCPFATPYFHLGHLTDLAFDSPCKSPACETCGPELADNLLKLVASRIEDLDVVYVAETRWGPNLGSRLGQRRKAHNLNTFMYRVVNDSVTIIADKPITGTKEPNVSRAMTPVEAIEFLRDSVMWVPGRHSQSWSDAWKPEGDDEASIHVSLRGLTETQIQSFTQTAVNEARSRYGIEPGKGLIPAEQWTAFRHFLIELRDRMIGGS